MLPAQVPKWVITLLTIIWWILGVATYGGVILASFDYYPEVTAIAATIAYTLWLIDSFVLAELQKHEDETTGG